MVYYGCLSVEEAWLWVSECRWNNVDCGCLSVEYSLLWVSECGRRLTVGV